MQDFLQHFDKKNSRNFENLSVGDFIKVGFLVQDKEKKRSQEHEKDEEERIQFFEGIIIAMTGQHYGKKMTLRKFGIERVFCYQNPQIQTFKILQRFRPTQNFHRSKLYYLRQRPRKRAFGRKDI